ncbi:amidohydrolase family protein [Phenylobacterium sp. SCN 70-31]|uniref:amidohydrolase family protein n=1 Tax=Phenylobacterium sp. SCN 70-31 TaxID=1660129 RepID=UPI00086F6930|nr:amidohydrolase family protein [Phenylobacterium sp. SCN 70-31]ODT89349.1 MAG: amidohydrolase [Phenylobacterium sp. SCN 70-31]
MAYVEGQTIHDADSHIMELPGTIHRYLDPRVRDDFIAKTGKKDVLPEWFAKAADRHEDPEFRAGAEANILLRKNYEALGAFRADDRPATLDHLGFASQLVFTTACLSNWGLEQAGEIDLAVEAARAHNRMMTDFCSVDRRLLATGYVPLADRARAPEIAREAIALGAKGLVVPSRHPPGFSPSHVELDPLWALAEEAGLPILFHVGGEEKMAQAYAENGLPQVKDFHGGDENFTSVTFMAIPLSIWQTLSVMVIDGVFDRFPRLKFGAIELGASWLPSLMKFLDSGCAAFGKEERLQRLSARPSEILRRQLRVTPYPHEDVAWIMANAGDEMALFSSDFPHVEGGRNPLKRFNESLEGVSAARKRMFYRDNFIDLMGAGLDPALHDLPALAA